MVAEELLSEPDNISCCEQVIEIADEDNRMRHALFARLVMGWDDLTCIHVREQFGHIPLTLATMREMQRLHEGRL